MDRIRIPKNNLYLPTEEDEESNTEQSIPIPFPGKRMFRITMEKISRVKP